MIKEKQTHNKGQVATRKVIRAITKTVGRPITLDREPNPKLKGLGNKFYKDLFAKTRSRKGYLINGSGNVYTLRLLLDRLVAKYKITSREALREYAYAIAELELSEGNQTQERAILRTQRAEKWILSHQVEILAR